MLRLIIEKSLEIDVEIKVSTLHAMFCVQHSVLVQKLGCFFVSDCVDLLFVVLAVMVMVMVVCSVQCNDGVYCLLFGQHDLRLLLFFF